MAKVHFNLEVELDDLPRFRSRADAEEFLDDLAWTLDNALSNVEYPSLAGMHLERFWSGLTGN